MGGFEADGSSVWELSCMGGRMQDELRAHQCGAGSAWRMLPTHYGPGTWLMAAQKRENLMEK